MLSVLRDFHTKQAGGPSFKMALPGALDDFPTMNGRLLAADVWRLSHKLISSVSSGLADAKRRCDPTIRQSITGRSQSGFAGSRPARTSKLVVFLLVFLVGWGIDDEVMGVEAVFDGVLAGDVLAIVGIRPGGQLGIGPVGDELFFANRHITPLIRCDLFTGEEGGKTIDLIVILIEIRRVLYITRGLRACCQTLHI